MRTDKWGQLVAVVGLFLVVGLMISVNDAEAGAVDVSLKLDGQVVETDVPPRIESDRTLVPIRAVSESMGLEVKWLSETRQVLITAGDDLDAGYVLLGIGDKTAIVDDDEVQLDVKPYIDSERTMVPVRFVTESLGANVDWDGDTRTVLIYTSENESSNGAPDDDDRTEVSDEKSSEEDEDSKDITEDSLYDISLVQSEEFFGLRFDISGDFNVSESRSEDDLLVLQVKGVGAADALANESRYFPDGPVSDVSVRVGKEELRIHLQFREDVIYQLKEDDEAFVVEFAQLNRIEVISGEPHPQVNLYISLPIYDTTSSFVLPDPPRCIVDIKGVVLSREIGDLDIDKGILKSMRMGQHRESLGDSFDGTRIVLDLAQEHQATINVEPQGEQTLVSVAFNGDNNPTLPLKGKMLVVDPGHGGSDTGGESYTNTVREKTVVLEMSKKIRTVLEDAGAEVIMTREGDYGVPLYDRPEIANEAEADLFISVHANADPYGHTQGTETYYYNPHNESDPHSERLAYLLHEQIVQALRRPDRGVRHGNFAVLRESDMPAVLLETLYLTSAQEERLLRSPRVQDLIAQAVREGIIRFLSR